MGYTNYYELKRHNLSTKDFDKIVKDVKIIEDYIKNNVVISKNAGGQYTERVTLHDGMGCGKGVLYIGETQNNKTRIKEIFFNGDAKQGLDHEGFGIRSGAQNDSFCKTARKPYDLVVCMVLLSLQYHVNTSKVSSDGNIEDWEHAIDLWKELFPERNLEIFGLSKEFPNLYIVRLPSKVKEMKIKEDAFDYDEKRIKEEYKDL